MLAQCNIFWLRTGVDVVDRGSGGGRGILVGL